MKRRMSAAEREQLEAVARPVIAQYVKRSSGSALLRRTAQSSMPLIREIGLRGHAVHLAVADVVGMTPSQQWLLAMEWLLQRLDFEAGDSARHVLVFRLSRPQKTLAASFEQIAADITAGYVESGRSTRVSMEEAEALYRAALPRFVRLLRERNIGPSLDGIAEVVARGPQPLPERTVERLTQLARLKRVRFGRRRPNPALAQSHVTALIS